MEVCIEGVWETVCHNSWSSSDARVVCKQLGFEVGRQLGFEVDSVACAFITE